MMTQLSSEEYILAIDPGNVESAYCIIDKHDLKPLEKQKVKNEHLLNLIQNIDEKCLKNTCIEMIGHYGSGMPAGKSVFDTCLWIGRFSQVILDRTGTLPSYIMRSEEKMCLCGNTRAKDSNIRQALIDRFAKFDFKNGKGTKKNQDWFYGFSFDCWQAYAVGITYYEKQNGG